VGDSNIAKKERLTASRTLSPYKREETSDNKQVSQGHGEKLDAKLTLTPVTV